MSLSWDVVIKIAALIGLVTPIALLCKAVVDFFRGLDSKIDKLLEMHNQFLHTAERLMERLSR